mgnify:CR=1 FL=1
MIVRFAPRAEAKFAAVLVTLYEANPFASSRFLDEVDRAIERLSQFPRLGSYVREYPALPLRESIVEPYRLFYIIDENTETVWIVDVWHGAQVPTAPQLPSQ